MSQLLEIEWTSKQKLEMLATAKVHILIAHDVLKEILCDCDLRHSLELIYDEDILWNLDIMLVDDVPRILNEVTTYLTPDTRQEK